MKLEPLPGAPGYMVDTDAMAAYSYKRGTLRRIKTKTIYRACNISVDGKAVGTTIYRMVYCVQRGIDITKIPKGVCIGVNQYGSITVVTSSEISEKASRTVEARSHAAALFYDDDAREAYIEGATETLDELKTVMSVSEEQHLRTNLGKMINYLEGGEHE